MVPRSPHRPGLLWTPGVAIGEPVHIPGDRHDYWGAIGTDPAAMRSRFYLLAADNPADGPLATIDLPIQGACGPARSLDHLALTENRSRRGEPVNYRLAAAVGLTA